MHYQRFAANTEAPPFKIRRSPGALLWGPHRPCEGWQHCRRQHGGEVVAVLIAPARVGNTGKSTPAAPVATSPHRPCEGWQHWQINTGRARGDQSSSPLRGLATLA